jgi:DNA-binding response OmpR family regulator
MNLNDVLPLRPSTSPPPPSPHLYEGPLCILVVDDDPIAREYLAETLRSQGHEVLTLGAAAGAAAVVRERGVDAVVVDVTLPDMRGDVLARRLREEGWGRDLGIVLVSGRTNEELQRLAALSSADAAVTKAEVDSQLLREVIRARRRRHQTSRPGRAVRSG